MQHLSIAELLERINMLHIDMEHCSFGWTIRHNSQYTWFFIDIPQEDRAGMRVIGNVVGWIDQSTPIAILRRSGTWSEQGNATDSYGLVRDGFYSLASQHVKSQLPVIVFHPDERSIAAALVYLYSLIATNQRDDLLIIPLAPIGYYFEVNHHQEIVCTHQRDMQMRHVSLRARDA